MNSVWGHMLTALEPQIDVLTDIMNNGAKIQINSIVRSSGIDASITDNSIITLDYDSSELNKRIDWAKDQLQQWKSCNQLEWDTWRFVNIEAYEKFITLYYLKWPP